MSVALIADRIWFDRHPERQLRVRAAALWERAAWSARPPSDHALLALVRRADRERLLFSIANPGELEDWCDFELEGLAAELASPAGARP